MMHYESLKLELESIMAQTAKPWALDILNGADYPHCVGASVEIVVVQRGGARHLVLDGDACKRVSSGLIDIITREIECQRDMASRINGALSAADALVDDMMRRRP